MDTPSPQTSSQFTRENRSSAGSVVGTVIILALIILGALYFWGKRLEEARRVQNIQNFSNTSAVSVDVHVGH